MFSSNKSEKSEKSEDRDQGDTDKFFRMDNSQNENTDSNLISIPVDLDDPKLQEKLTKTQLYSVIKNLNNQLVELTNKFNNKTPDIEGIVENVIKKLDSQKFVKETNDILQPVSGLPWTMEQIESFMQPSVALENKNEKIVSGSNIKEDGKILCSGNVPHTSHSIPSPPSAQRVLKMDPNTPKFHGNVNEDVDDWLYKVKINLDIAAIPAHLYCDFITNYCVGKAGVFLRRLREHYSSQFQKLTWSELHAAFIKRYRPIDHTRRIRNQLMQMRQGNDFHAYVDQFQQLLNQLEPDELSEQEKLHYFTEGLHSETKFQIISRKVRTLDSAILIASEFDSCRQKTIVSVQMAHKLHNRKNNSWNAHPKNVGNNDMLRHRNYNGKKRYPTTHYSSSVVPSQKGVENAKEKIITRCFRCNKTGHLASNCTMSCNKATVQKQEKILSAIDNQLEMLKIRGSINDINVDFYFDSGATTSIISHRIVKLHNLQILPSTVQIKSANNSIDTVIGITDSLRINVENHICNLPLLIMDLDQYDVLLGLNWFQATKAGLYPAQKILKFEAEQIHLESNDNTTDTEEVNVIGLDEEDLLPINFEILSEKDESICATAPLTADQNIKFNDLVSHINNIGLFAYNYQDLKGCDLWPHVIHTSSEVPIFVPRYRKSQYENDLIKTEIKKLLDANIIRPSSSPWSSSVVLVPKPHNEKRLCIDYRKLNAITIPDMFPLPRIQDILDSLSGSFWFTVFDLKSGYYQTFIEDNSIKKTAFTTADGHYEFVRTPFGLKNAPSQFSRFMQMLFGNRPFISIYLDDLTIHSITFDEHIAHVRETIDILNKNKLKINKKKCIWFAKTIRLLGHIVSGGVVKMDPQKIKAIMERKPPKDRKQVQEFLGLPNYYRRFIHKFADITYPIANLLKKDVPFNWDNECQSAFELLKKKVTEAPILQQPDFRKQFVLHCDASGYALGVILTQVTPTEANYFCKDWVVSYGSRLLKGAELNYGITQKECLAIVWGIKHYHTYLYGTKFIVVTDHIALSWLNHTPTQNGRLARWAMYLQEYTFDVVYRKGKLHANVDALSRPVLAVTCCMMKKLTDEGEHGEDISKIIDAREDSYLLYYLQHKKHLPGASNRQVKRVMNMCDHYMLDLSSNVLYFRKRVNDPFLIVPEIKDRRDIIEQAHLQGHFNTQSTTNRIKQTYFWAKMHLDIKNFVDKCLSCKRANRGKVYHHSAQALPITALFDRIGMDLVLGLPSDNVHNYNGILVLTEYLSKYPYAVPIRSKEAVEIAEHLFQFISIFGPPKTILSDQGREFVNEVVDKLLVKIGTEHRVTSAYHPNTNGQTERMNQTLILSLRKHCEAHPSDWFKWLPFILMSYRTRVHSATGLTPFFLMFGREMLTFNNWHHNKDINEVLAVEKRTAEIKNHFEANIPQTIVKIKAKQKSQIATQNATNTILSTPLPKDTTVYVRNEGLLGKLEPRFKGPFLVNNQTNSGNYKLRDMSGAVLEKSYPIEKLKLSQDDDTNNIYVIETILNDRVFRQKQQYLVKWKDFPTSSNSWENESNFVSLKPIQDYWKHKQACKSPLRRSKRLERVNTCSIVTTPSSIHSSFWVVVIIIASLIQPHLSVKIVDTFKYCDGISSARRVDINTSCKQLHSSPEIKWTPMQPKNNLFNASEFAIIKKLSHAVSGTGFQCSMTKLTVETFMGLFFEQSEKLYNEPITLSMSECWFMIHSKRCKDKQMLCDGLSCEYKAAIKPSYKWLQLIKHEDYSCYTSPRVISAKNINDTLFGHSYPPCQASNLYCLKQDHIIVWTYDVIHSCPFEVIAFTTLDRQGGNVYLSTQDHLLFQLTGAEDGCGVGLISTAEGLYVLHRSRASMFKHSEKTIKDIQDLTLADSDFHTSKFLEFFTNIQKTLCEQTLTTIRMFSKFNDEYFEVADRKGTPIILYAKSKSVYIPHCNYINEVEVISNTTQCYRDIPIRFLHKNKSISAFLRDNNILTMNSKLISCLNIKSYIHLGHSNYQIKRVKNVNLVEPAKQGDLDRLNLINANVFNYNYHHMHDIIEGIDVFDELENFNQIADQTENFIISTDTVQHAENIIVKPADKLVDQVKKLAGAAKASVNSMRIFFLIVIISVITLLCLLLLFTYRRVILELWKRRFVFSKLVQPLKNQNTDFTPAMYDQANANVLFPNLQNFALQEIHGQTIFPETTPMLVSHNYNEAEDYSVSLNTRAVAINLVKQLPTNPSPTGGPVLASTGGTC